MSAQPEEFLARIVPVLGWFYVACCGLNIVAAGRLWRRGKWGIRWFLWAAFAVGFAVLAARSFVGRPPEMPAAGKSAIDAALGPMSLSVGCFVALLVLYLGRRFFVIPAVAFAGLNASLLFLGASLSDVAFAAVVGKPDNVPIVALVYLLGFFLWWATAQAVENDRRLSAGSPPLEQQHAERVLVWPDLVYIELIAMILVTVLLVVWSLCLQAPLEQPANPAVTPNPSKAPWYFLGLQELLTSADPWWAGVTVPCLIVLGLGAIPYLDCNRQGNGYYTIQQRRFAYGVFMLGFLLLWILLILVGTFLRGPNWSFFGLYEVRDPHKLLPLRNVKLSEYFWTMLLGREVPQVPENAGGLTRLGLVLWREMAGVVLLALYFLALPPLLGGTVFRNLRRQMGPARYALMIVLLLSMMTLPWKMILRWTVNLSYLVSMPEYSLNF
jgi:hypothetical protein